MIRIGALPRSNPKFGGTLSGPVITTTGNITAGGSFFTTGNYYLNNNAFIGGAAGAIDITATGANKSITLTPSGTGGVVVAAGPLVPSKVATGAAPAYVEGNIYYDTTLHKLRVGGGGAYETITSV